MFRFSVILITICTLLSCEKQEGEGGLASIEGVVLVQNVNSLKENIGAPYIAKDEDVFISYGDNTTNDDDIKTSPEGSFKFNYLMPGNYSVFVYSDDTSSFNLQEKIVVKQQITINEKKEKFQMDTIIIYKYVDYNDGTSSVSGVVYQYEYYDGTTVKKDSIPAQNADVFLKYSGDNQILDRFRTSYDGSFKITNLISGNYTVYVYSEVAYQEELAIKSYDFEVAGSNQKIVADTLKISNF